MSPDSTEDLERRFIRLVLIASCEGKDEEADWGHVTAIAERRGWPVPSEAADYYDDLDDENPHSAWAFYRDIYWLSKSTRPSP